MNLINVTNNCIYFFNPKYHTNEKLVRIFVSE